MLHKVFVIIFVSILYQGVTTHNLIPEHFIVNLNQIHFILGLAYTTQFHLSR